MSKITRQLTTQTQRDVRRAVEMREKAIAMREHTCETRLHLWLNRLADLRAQTSRETALERALDAALSVASADCANIQLMHPTGLGLELTAQRGFNEPFLNFFEFVDGQHTACGLTLKERRTVVVPDITLSPIFAQTTGLHVMLSAGIRSVRSTPLINRAGGIRGVLSVHYTKPRAHVDSETTRLQKLAEAVTVLIGDCLRR